MKTNHRRGFQARAYTYGGGPGARGVANPHRAFPDKSMQGWAASGPLSGVRIGAGIGNDFCRGNRGMARAVRGAKKFVRSRLRHHENAAARRLARQAGGAED